MEKEKMSGKKKVLIILGIVLGVCILIIAAAYFVLHHYHSKSNYVRDDQVQQILQLVKKFNELNLDPDTFLNLFQAKEGVENFFTSVGDFFKSIGDFFVNLFGGGN